MTDQYRLVVFDWEGALTNSQGQLLHVLAEEAKKLSIGDIDLSQITICMDCGPRLAIKKNF